MSSEGWATSHPVGSSETSDENVSTFFQFNFLFGKRAWFSWYLICFRQTTLYWFVGSSRVSEAEETWRTIRENFWTNKVDAERKSHSERFHLSINEMPRRGFTKSIDVTLWTAFEAQSFISGWFHRRRRDIPWLCLLFDFFECRWAGKKFWYIFKEDSVHNRD